MFDNICIKRLILDCYDNNKFLGTLSNNQLKKIKKYSKNTVVFLFIC